MTLPCTCPHLVNVILYSPTVGQQWMGSSCTYRNLGIPISKNVTITGGLMIPTWLPFFAFVPTEHFQMPFLMSSDLFTIVRLRSWGRFTKNWNKFITKKVENVVLIRLLGTWTGSTFTNHVKKCWDHRLLPARRGLRTLGKKERQRRRGEQQSGGCWHCRHHSQGYGTGLYTKSMASKGLY